MSALSSLNFLQAAFPNQLHKPGSGFRSSSARNKEGSKDDGVKRRGTRRDHIVSDSTDEEDFANIPSDDMTLDIETESPPPDAPIRRSKRGRSPARR